MLQIQLCLKVCGGHLFPPPAPLDKLGWDWLLILNYLSLFVDSDFRGHPQTFIYEQDSVLHPHLLMQERDIHWVRESESCPSLTSCNTSTTSGKASGTRCRCCCNWCSLGWNLHLTGCRADSSLFMRQLADIAFPTDEQLIADDSLQHYAMTALFFPMCKTHFNLFTLFSLC